jgi:hypothetical protein
MHKSSIACILEHVNQYQGNHIYIVIIIVYMYSGASTPGKMKITVDCN